MKKIIFTVGIILLIILFFPCLFISANSGNILIIPMIREVNLKIRFIHSVQKTPVEEYLKVERLGKITLYETHYQSFGVGLPFLEDEGNFHQEGDVFVLKMNREFKDLALRIGKDTELTLNVDEEILLLYEMMKAGSRVDIAVKPYIMGKLLN